MKTQRSLEKLIFRVQTDTKASLLCNFVGVVYYKELMREKAKTREQQRRVSKVADNIKLGSVYKTRPKRQPRSMLQIRESLKQMMEAEVIGKLQ